MLSVMALAVAAAQPSPAGRIGVDVAAAAQVSGSPATFDIAGFRLGMTEEQAERVLRQRGMTVRRRTRGRPFEDRVRELVNVRGGTLPLKGGSVLDTADVDDGRGGRIMIRMLAWPGGARIRGVTYTAPAGTVPADWQARLVAKYGPASRDSEGIGQDVLHARWCGKAACLGESGLFRLGADVDARGGQLTLSQPEGTSGQLTALVEAEAARIGPRGVPSF